MIKSTSYEHRSSVQKANLQQRPRTTIVASHIQFLKQTNGYLTTYRKPVCRRITAFVDISKVFGKATSAKECLYCWE